MSFRISESNLLEYHKLGYTVFRQVVPTSLVSDLRSAVDPGRELARSKHGPQAQRLQPVADFQLEPGPFQAFRELPELREALTRLLGPDVSFGDPDLLGVLIEPLEGAWCTRWHRDWRDNAPYLDIAQWDAVFHQIACFNQCNCSLYEDHSLWVVPGSHLRGDTEEERALFPDRPIRSPEFDGLASLEREYAARDYARAMPGAVQVHLGPGDYALYRNTLWHLGSYVPYARRATLHDFVDTPEYSDFRKRMSEDMDRRKAAGHPPWEWSATWIPKAAAA